jgi:uncharacterized protein
MIIDSHAHVRKIPDSPYADSRKKNLLLLIKEARANKVNHLLIIAGFKDKNGTIESTKIAAQESMVSVIGSIDILTYTTKDLVQLEKLLRKKLIVGIKLYTGYQHFYPSDKRCTPIYKLCLKYQVPVIFHSGDTLAGYTKNPKIKYSHPIHIDDVATDFPDLKIVIAHMGNPWLTDCAEVLYKNPNVYADVSGLVVGDNLNTPYGQLMRRKIKDLIDYVGEDKLLYGTDWPLCSMKTYLKFVRGLGLPKKSLERLLYKNAIKVFGLKI